MITDLLATFSGTSTGSGITGQTVTGTSVAVLGTSSYDLGVARDIGKGEPMNIAFEVVTAASGGTSVQFQYVQADDAALSTNLEVLGETDAIPVASLTAGTQIVLPVPRVEPRNARRYVGVQYNLAGAVAAGAYFAAMVHDVSDKQQSYASGFSVL